MNYEYQCVIRTVFLNVSFFSILNRISSESNADGGQCHGNAPDGLIGNYRNYRNSVATIDSDVAARFTWQLSSAGSKKIFR